MISGNFASIKNENNGLNITFFIGDGNPKINAKDIKIYYDEMEKLYYVKAFMYKEIFVCSREENAQSDVVLVKIDEEMEIDEDFITSLNNEVLNLIQYTMNDLYIDTRKNQYTGDRDSYVFLKKGNYRLKEMKNICFWTNNILVEQEC
jgi:hypothetical protein